MNTIMMAVDGTSGSEQSLPFVTTLASAWEADVVVVEVVPTPGAAESDAAREQESTARAYVEHIATRLRSRGIEARGVVERGAADALGGAASAALVTRAIREHAGMLVLCTRGRAGLTRLRRGSVVEDVMRRGGPPLFIARMSEDAVEIREPRIRHILWPVDGSEDSLRAAAITARLAHAYGAEVTIAHFVSMYASEETMAYGYDHVHIAGRVLARLGIDAHTTVRRGDPVTGIVELGLFEPARPAVDLVVMASEGRRGISRWLQRSVAASVIRHALVPVVIVPPAPQEEVARSTR